MKVLLIRHGETTDNALNILQGHRHGVLSEKGIKQAHSRGEKLKGTHVDIIISSDLGRSIETATIINTYLGVPQSSELLLREKDWGSLTGKDISHYYKGIFPDDIENDEQLFARAKRLLCKLRNEYKDKTVLLLGHGAINVAIKAVLTKVPAKIMMNNIDIQENLNQWDWVE
jgi:probable phosphoglycerate mutase